MIFSSRHLNRRSPLRGGEGRSIVRSREIPRSSAGEGRHQTSPPQSATSRHGKIRFATHTIVKKLAATAFCIVMALFSASTNAAIDKLARPGSSGLDLVWWPRLPKVEGWKHDEDASWAISANVLLRKGENFSDAPAVIYASATYKPRTTSKTLQQFIAAEQEDFSSRVPGVRIEKLSPLVDAGGNRLETCSFTPSRKGDWEVLAYGEEDEFFLIFAVSAHGKDALRAAMPAFRSLVARYKR